MDNKKIMQPRGSSIKERKMYFFGNPPMERYCNNKHYDPQRTRRVIDGRCSICGLPVEGK